MKNFWGLVIGLVALLVIIGVVIGKSRDRDLVMEPSNTDTMMETDSMMTDDTMMSDNDADSMMNDASNMMMKTGTYEAYAPEKLARANDGNVVLFFRASWCPTCRALDADIRAHVSAIPSDLTILDVNYDTATELKKKYGVTYQHTMVQVNADGSMITKWSGSPTLAKLVAEVK